MLTLLAYAPDERWAYVREGDRHLLLRPPYQQDLAVRDADVERAVTVHGYTVSDRTFATRRELFDFLRHESVRVWHAHNPRVDLATLRAELLDSLSVEDLDRQITRAQQKVDQGRSQDALVLLDRLGTAKALTHKQRQHIGEVRARIRERAEEEARQRQSARWASFALKFRRAAQALGEEGVALASGELRPAA